RASRATELANEFPAHVAAAWLGHSTLVANKHFWQVTDDDFAKATGTGTEAAQKAAQPAHAAGRVKSHEDSTAHDKAPVLLGSATSGATLQNWGMGDEGTEHIADFTVNPSLSKIGA